MKKRAINQRTNSRLRGKRCCAIITLILAVQALAGAALGRTLYVNDDGNPDASHISGANFYASAALAFREAATDSSVSEIIIYPGTYRETIDIASIERSSLSPLVARKAKISDFGWQSAMQNEDAVIDGRETVESLRTNAWSFDPATKIWSVTLSTDAVLDVFYGDAGMIQARWPDIIDDADPAGDFAYKNILTDKAWCRTQVPGTGIWPVIFGIEQPFYTTESTSALQKAFTNCPTVGDWDIWRGKIVADTDTDGPVNWNGLAQIIEDHGEAAFKQATLVYCWWDDFQIWATYLKSVNVTEGNPADASTINQVEFEYDMRAHQQQANHAFGSGGGLLDSFFLTNSRIFLDQQKEWFFDRDTKVLSFRPPMDEGQTVGDTDWQPNVSVRVRRTGLEQVYDTAWNEADYKVDYVTIDGLAFIASGIYMEGNIDQTYTAESTTMDTLVSVNNLDVVNCKFRYSTTGYSRDGRGELESTDPSFYTRNLADPTDTFVGGGQNIIRGNSVSFISNEMFFGTRAGLFIVGGNAVFENNLVDHFCLYGDANDEPVWVGIGAKTPPASFLPSASSNNKFRYNTIINSGGGMITFSGKDSEVAYNRFHNSYLARHAEHGDGSMVHVYGGATASGVHVHHNWMSGCYPSDWLDERAYTGENLNRNGLGGRGLRLSESTVGGVITDGFYAHHNMIWDIGGCGIKLPKAGTNYMLYNNTIFNMGRSCNAQDTTGFAEPLIGDARSSGIMINYSEPEHHTSTYIFNNIMPDVPVVKGSWIDDDRSNQFGNETDMNDVWSGANQLLAGLNPARANSTYTIVPQPGNGFDTLETYDSFLPDTGSAVIDAGYTICPTNLVDVWTPQLTNWLNSGLLPASSAWTSGNGYVGSAPDIGAYEQGEHWIPGSTLGLTESSPLLPTPTLDEYQVGAGDTTPPTPNPATWSQVPAATGMSSIAMTASIGSDPSGPVEYQFDCMTAGGHNSDWQTSRSYTDYGLTPNTSYSYRFRMRDSEGNAGAYSSIQSATTSNEVQLVIEDFESGTLGTYTDGGADAGLNADTNFARGSYSGYIRDDTETSTLTLTEGVDTQGANVVMVTFEFLANSMDDGKAFDLKYESAPGIWTTLKRYTMVAGGTYENDIWYTVEEPLAAPPASLRIRFECEAGSNFDKVYIDNIMIAASGPPSGPLPPSWLDASLVSGTDVNLAWIEGSLADTYNVYRSTNSGTYGAALASSVSGTNYVDATVVEGETYYYVVSSVDTGSVESAFSDEVEIVVDSTAPAAPTGLTIATNGASFELAWDANGESDLASYSVYRSTESGVFGVPLEVDVATNALDTAAPEFGVTYYYVVTATDASGNESAVSAQVAGSMVAPPTELITGESVHDFSSELQAQVGYGATNMVNEGGLTDQGDDVWYHDTDAPGLTYLSDVTSVAWLEFDLGEVTTLTEIHLWNGNHSLANRRDRGAKTIDVYVSNTPGTAGDNIDNGTWGTKIATISPAMGPGSNDYAGERFDITDTEGRYVRLDITENHGDAYTALNEVHFYAIPEPKTAYELWEEEYGLQEGPDGDDDGDGLVNLGEYGIGGNPTNPADFGYLPTFGRVIGGGSNGFEYIHVQQTDPNSGLLYYLELSDNLVSNVWSTNGYTVVGSGPFTNGFDIITNRIDTEIRDTQFIRLKIEQE